MNDLKVDEIKSNPKNDNEVNESKTESTKPERDQENHHQDKIIRRIYVKGTLVTASPLIIGSGEDNNSDIDIIRDWYGEPFIPASSMAGAIRHFMDEILPCSAKKGKNAENHIITTLLGERDKESTQSLITFYDAHPLPGNAHLFSRPSFLGNFERLRKIWNQHSSNITPFTLSLLPAILGEILNINGNAIKNKMSLRDGVRIDDITKTAENRKKFQYEIINPGTEFDFKMEVVIREKNRSKISDIENMIYTILSSMQEKKIPIGAKTRRGMGELEFKRIVEQGDDKEKTGDTEIKKKLNNKKEEEKSKKGDILILYLNMENKEDARKWLNFDWNEFGSEFDNDKRIKPNKKVDELKDNSPPFSSPLSTTTINATFSIPYSLLIRHYNEDPSLSDTVHLTRKDKGGNNQGIIPGSSWAGVLSHTIKDILRALKINDNKRDKIIAEIFGFAGPEWRELGYDNRAGASRICVKESVVSGGNIHPYTRNKVDRFTGGVVDSALFDESPLYGKTDRQTAEVRLEITLKPPMDIKGEKPTAETESDKSSNLETKKTEIKEPLSYESQIALILLAIKDIGNGISPVGGGANIGRGILQEKMIEIKNGETTLPFDCTTNPHWHKDPRLQSYFQSLANDLKGGC